MNLPKLIITLLFSFSLNTGIVQAQFNKVMDFEFPYTRYVSGDRVLSMRLALNQAYRGNGYWITNESKRRYNYRGPIGYFYNIKNGRKHDAGINPLNNPKPITISNSVNFADFNSRFYDSRGRVNIHQWHVVSNYTYFKPENENLKIKSHIYRESGKNHIKLSSLPRYSDKGNFHLRFDYENGSQAYLFSTNHVGEYITKIKVWTFGKYYDYRRIRFSRNEKLMAYASGRSQISIIRTDTGDNVSNYSIPIGAEIFYMVFSHDNRKLFVHSKVALRSTVDAKEIFGQDSVILDAVNPGETISFLTSIDLVSQSMSHRIVDSNAMGQIDITPDQKYFCIDNDIFTYPGMQHIFSASDDGISSAVNSMMSRYRFSSDGKYFLYYGSLYEITDGVIDESLF